MTPVNKMLAGALVVQLGLAAFTWNQGPGDAEGAATRPLLSFDVEDVTALEVVSKGEDAEPVRVERKDEGWVVTSAEDYPAKEKSVEEAIQKLLDLEVGAPLATRKANHNALRVGEREFDKRVKLTANGETVELVVGSAKGTSVHVRRADDENVYWARGLSAWSISDATSTYVDTQYVKVEEPREVTVENEHGGFTLVKKDGAWTLQGADPATLDASKIESFVRTVSSIRMAEPAGTEVKPEHGLADGATVSIQGTTKGEGDEEGTPVSSTYVVGAEEDGKFFLKAEDRSHVVLVSKWSVEKILEKKPADFAKTES